MRWLKPYLRTWYATYPESVPPVRQIAHVIRGLVKVHPEARICEELAAYLGKTPPQYLNLAKFAATFGSWTPPAPVKPLPNQRWRCCNHPDREITSRYDNKPLCPECVEALP